MSTQAKQSVLGLAHNGARKQSQNTLIRYPGGKQSAVDRIIQYFPDNLDEMGAPFLGGGAVEVRMAYKGVKVYGSDVRAELCEFWKFVREQPEAVADAMVSMFSDLEEENARFWYYTHKKQYDNEKDPAKRSAIFLLTICCAFSCIPFGGLSRTRVPIFLRNMRSGKLPSAIRNFHVPNLLTRTMDYADAIAVHAESERFLYIDPPYSKVEYSCLVVFYEQGLRGQRPTSKHFDHEKLARIMSKYPGKWVMSYNDCEKIRKLYRKFKIVKLLKPNTVSGAWNRKALKDEILILNV